MPSGIIVASHKGFDKRPVPYGRFPSQARLRAPFAYGFVPIFPFRLTLH